MLVDDGTGGISGAAIGMAIGIHRKWGPGLLEKFYLGAFVDALRSAGYSVDCQPRLSIAHAGVRVAGYRPDMIVNRCLVIEVKSVPVLLVLHKQQLSTYLRLAGIRAGLLINFNVPVLRDGIRRVLLKGC
jgi:GxxExxY protein